MSRIQSSIFTALLCVLGNILFLNSSFAHDHHNNHHHNNHHYDDNYYGAAFFGGMVTDQIMTNMALEADAMRRPEPMQYGDHADHRSLVERREHPYQQTVSSRLAELDQLAASGAITPQQYKNRRLAIVDGL